MTHLNAIIVHQPEEVFALRHHVRIKCHGGEERIYVEVRSADAKAAAGAPITEAWHPLFWVPMDCPF